MEDTGDCVQQILSSDSCPKDHTDHACNANSPLSERASQPRREDPCAPPSKPSLAHNLPQTLQVHNEAPHTHNHNHRCHLCAIAEQHLHGGAPPPQEPENPYPVNPVLDPHLSHHDITNRYHNVWGYIFRWTGTVTEVSIIRIVTYALYSVGAYALAKYLCTENGNQDKCEFLSGELSMLFTLWSAFLAYLFQSFVNAGLDRFNLTNTQIRSTQGRLNEISLLCHSHARPKADQTLCTIRRLCSAFPFVMHSPAVMGGTPEFVDHIQRILEEEEFNCLMKIREGDRAYAMLDWMMVLFHRALEADEWRQGNNLIFRLQGTIERLRGTVGTLTDSLDDAILPFPFTNLITINVYLVFVLLPIVMSPILGGSAIIGAGSSWGRLNLPLPAELREAICIFITCAICELLSGQHDTD